MDRLNALTTGEKLTAGGGVLMLIAAFLPWYKISIQGFGSLSQNGLESPGAIWSMLATLIAVVVAAVIIGSRFGNMSLPDLGSITWGQAHLVLGAIVLVCVLLKMVNESNFMAIGFYLGIIAAIALAGGGYLLYSEEKQGAGRQ